MSAELSPKANPMAPFESAWYRLVLLFFVAFLTVLWFLAGPSNPAYALMVAWGTCSIEPVLAAPFLRGAFRPWFRVPAGERVLHRVMGVGIFGWLLEVCGWNRLIRPMRGFSGNKAGLVFLEQHAQAGAIAHGVCFLIHMLLAFFALFREHPWRGALWMLLPAVVLHLYPFLLQRSMMLRLQPLLDRTAPADWIRG